MSNTRKLPHEFSVDDLLKQLDEKTVAEPWKNTDHIKVSSNPILSFLQAYNIKIGTKKVKADTLYKLFRLWKKDTLIDKKNFNFQLHKYIMTGIIRNKLYVFMNKEMGDILMLIESIKKEHTLDRTKSKHFRLHFETFLKKHEIKEGKLRVESDILYHLYDTWCYKRGKHPIPYNKFTTVCDLYLEYKSPGDQRLRYYYVDQSIKNYIDPTTVKNWREGRQKYGKKTTYQFTKKEASNILYPETIPNKKKSYEISCTRSEDESEIET